MAECELVADGEITAGGCRVETRFGTIDEQFEGAIGEDRGGTRVMNVE